MRRRIEWVMFKLDYWHVVLVGAVVYAIYSLVTGDSYPFWAVAFSAAFALFLERRFGKASDYFDSFDDYYETILEKRRRQQ